MNDGRQHHPERDPDEKAFADGIEEAIVAPSSIEEEMMLEAAEIEEITYQSTTTED